MCFEQWLLDWAPWALSTPSPTVVSLCIILKRKELLSKSPGQVRRRFMFIINLRQSCGTAQKGSFSQCLLTRILSRRGNNSRYHYPSIQLTRHYAATLGEPVSSCLMEVGRSVEVRCKVAKHEHNLRRKHDFILKQTPDGSSITRPQSVFNFHLRLYFPPFYS